MELLNLKSWFIKKYDRSFSLNAVYQIKNNTIEYFRSWANYDDYWHNPRKFSWIWWWNSNTLSCIRIRQRPSRTYKNRNKESGTTRNTEFFSNDKILERIENHRNILKEKLNWLSQSLNIYMESGDYVLDWVKEVKIVLPSKIIVSDMIVRNHLDLDNPDLLNEILDFNKKVEDHKENLKKYTHVLTAVIKNRFIEKGILPSNYPEFGFYFNDDYIHLLNRQLTSILEHIKKSKDLTGLKDRQIFSRIRNEDGYVQLGYFMIGRCDESKINDMQELVKSIPFEGIIMSELINLCKSVLDLKKQSENIQNKISDITQQIGDGQYNTIALCCPTRNKSNVP